MKPITKLLGIASLFVSASIFVDAIKNSAKAEITANPNDAGTVINQNGNTLNIEGGTRADKNLFHSFEKFGLETGQTANFKSNPEIENILGRVTGGDASVINGLIKVTGSNANLYLMNPAGIIFGNGARLDVPGSFHATTASGIGFGLVNWFKAFGENDYASLVGNFNYSVFTQGGTILNSGNLEVKEGQSLTLSGETVISTGTLKAPGGNINIRTLPEDTLVRIKQKGNLLSLSVSVNFPLPEEITNQSFTALSLPQLLTGGNLNNATGVEVENGVVKLTGSGTEIPDNAGIFISNNINTEGETNGNINISSESGNIILDGLNEPLNLFGDVEIEAYGSNSFIFLGSNINSFGDVKIEANGSNSFVILNGNINSSGDVKIENIFSISSKNTVILGGNINSSGDVEIELGIIMGGDITTNGGDITVEKISNFIKDITISTGEEVAGDIRISSFSEKNQGINNDFKPYNLTLISGTGDVDNYVRGKGIKNLNIDGNNVELSASNIAGNINVKASNDIEIKSVEANGDITLEAERDINMLKAAHLKLQTEKDINIIAGNKVEVRDSDDTQATISAGNNLLIQGDKRINIQAFNNKDSKLTSGNDLTLISDGLITGDTKFVNGGNFSATSLGGGTGNFEQTFTPNSDKIISSEGDVNFGNYNGLSLKIEAKGSITGGDITINGSNPNITVSDPDIELLTQGPGLVLRAGVDELQNKPNIPNHLVGGTNFTSPGKSSSANIMVGDITSPSVTISATGNINTGHIKTPTKSPQQMGKGLVDLLRATGDITVKTITSSGSNVANIKIEAGRLFRATEFFLKGGSGTYSNDYYGKEVSGLIPTSIYTNGFPASSISIQHGGRNFIIGPKFETDVTNTDVRLEGEEAIGTPISEDNIDEFTSFTAGAITFVGNNGGPMSSFRDSALDSNDSETTSVGSDSQIFGEIKITSKSTEIPENTPLESNNNNLSGTVENNVPDSTEQQSTSNEQATSKEQENPEPEAVQRQLTKKEQDEICSRQNSTTAVNRTGNTRKVKTTNNNPCKATNNDDNNILQVIPDNRFNNNSALPSQLYNSYK